MSTERVGEAAEVEVGYCFEAAPVLAKAGVAGVGNVHINDLLSRAGPRSLQHEHAQVSPFSAPCTRS